MTRDEILAAYGRARELRQEASLLKLALEERGKAVHALWRIALPHNDLEHCRAIARCALEAVGEPVPDATPAPKEAEAAKEPARPAVVEWLEERFREKRAWHRDELLQMGVAAGFRDRDVMKVKGVLPIMDFYHGNTWAARDGWPGPKEGGAA